MTQQRVILHSDMNSFYGRIVEQGDHEALLARKGKYYDLYMTQFAGFAT